MGLRPRSMQPAAAVQRTEQRFCPPTTGVALPRQTGVALPRQTGEPGGGVKTIEQEGV